MLLKHLMFRVLSLHEVIVYCMCFFLRTAYNVIAPYSHVAVPLHLWACVLGDVPCNRS